MAADVILVLNATWHLRAGQSSWLLCRRTHAGGSTAAHFANRKENLLRSIREHCGAVRPEAIAEIEDWPQRFREWLRLTGDDELPPAS